MPDRFGIKCHGVKPRPTYEELSKSIDYTVKFPDRSATFARDSPLHTQLDGSGMMDMEELERRDIIETHKEYMIRQIATDTGTPLTLAEGMQKIHILRV